mmetsp:Transcript_26335/g.52524  ORF Transcript_26335/g.52524 Transcript_26335/m.52524 type:complete len:209 (-) Transcript_26335:621-1247(-)
MTPLTSIPLAARSVHMSTSLSPALKLSRASSLWVWVRSPCISATRRPQSPAAMHMRCARALVSKKTMARLGKVRWRRERRMAGRLDSLPERTRTNSWTSRGATSTLPPGAVEDARTRTGLFMLRASSSFTLVVKVALKSIVWRRTGQAFTISRTSSEKPRSRRRSASSSTSTATSEREKPLAFEMWSFILPGVPTMKSGRFLSSAAWA